VIRFALLAVPVVLVALLALGCGSSAKPSEPAAADLPATANTRPELSAAARRADLRRALPLVSVSASSLGYTLRLAPRRDPLLRALTDTTAHTITLYLAEGDPPHRTAHDLAHEIGHAYDAARLTPAQRRAYLARRGVPRAAWWPTNRGSDYSVGAGDFAEVFALCHAASPEFRSKLAPRPADACATLPAEVAR
jgi:hypothetical protein